jgi:drug/metabolite transporter (DMT)-like permease
MPEIDSRKLFSKWKYVPEILLVIVTILWGTTFIITKKTTEIVPSFLYLSLRFGISFITLIPFLFRYKGFFLSWKKWKISLIAGSLYFVSIATQTIGLQDTTASKASFITGLGVIFVPLIMSIFYKKKIHFLLWIAVILSITGVGLLSFTGKERLSWGDPLVLTCAIFYAFYVIYLEKQLHEVEIMPFTAVQVFLIAIFSFILSIIIEMGILQITITPLQIFSFSNSVVYLYMGIIATNITFILQCYGQRFVSSSRASLIFAFEPFFATFFAILGGEILTVAIGIGMVLIFTAVLLSILTPQDPLQIEGKKTIGKE